MIQIEIPFKTPTINHLYGQHGFHRYMKPEAKKLKKLIQEVVEPFKGLIGNDKRLKVLVEVHEDWICKNGNVATKDISNREKFLIDCVFEELGLNDKFIWEQTFKKIINPIEHSIITIEEL